MLFHPSWSDPIFSVNQDKELSYHTIISFDKNLPNEEIKGGKVIDLIKPHLLLNSENKNVLGNQQLSAITYVSKAWVQHPNGNILIWTASIIQFFQKQKGYSIQIGIFSIPIAYILLKIFFWYLHD